MLATNIGSEYSIYSPEKTSTLTSASPLSNDTSIPQDSIHITDHNCCIQDTFLRHKLTTLFSQDPPTHFTKEDCKLCLEYLNNGTQNLSVEDCEAVKKCLKHCRGTHLSQSLGLTLHNTQEIDQAIAQIDSKLGIETVDGTEATHNAMCDELCDLHQSVNQITPTEQKYRDKMYLVNPDDKATDQYVTELINSGVISLSDSEQEIAAKLLEHLQSKFDYKKEKINPDGTINDHWQSVAETLAKGGGDCEDLSILLGSSLMNIYKRKGHSDNDVRSMVTLSAGYLKAGENGSAGHMLVKLNVPGKKGALALDATSKAGPKDFDSLNFEELFEFNDLQFKKYGEISEEFYTALSVANAQDPRSISNQIKTLSGRIETILSQDISIPWIDKDNIYKKADGSTAGTHLVRNGEMVQVTATDLANANLDVDDPNYVALPQTYNIVTTSHDFGFFRVDRVNLTADTGGASSPDVSALAGGGATEAINMDIFEARINYDEFIKYINDTRNLINKITLLYHIANSYAEYKNQASWEILTDSLDDEGRRAMDEVKKTGEKRRTSFTSTLNKFQEKQGQAVVDVANEIFSFVGSFNNARFNSARFTAETYARESFAAGVGSEVVNELTGVFDFLRSRALVFIGQREAQVNSYNAQQFVKFSQEMTRNIELWGVSAQEDHITDRAQNNSLFFGRKTYEILEGNNADATKRTVNRYLSEVESQITHLDSITAGGFNPGNFNSIYRFNSGLQRERHSMLNSPLFARDRRNVFVDINMPKNIYFKLYITNFQNAVRRTLIIKQAMMDAKREASEHVNEGVKASSSESALRGSVTNALNVELQKQMQAVDQVYQKSIQLTNSINTLIRSQIENGKAMANMAVKSTRTLATIALAITSQVVASAQGPILATPFATIASLPAITSPGYAAVFAGWMAFYTPTWREYVAYMVNTIGEAALGLVSAGAQLGIELGVEEEHDPQITQFAQNLDRGHAVGFSGTARNDAQLTQSQAFTNVFSDDHKQHQIDKFTYRLLAPRAELNKTENRGFDGNGQSFSRNTTEFLVDRGDGFASKDMQKIASKEATIAHHTNVIQLYNMLLKALYDAVETVMANMFGSQKKNFLGQFEGQLNAILGAEQLIHTSYKQEIDFAKQGVMDTANKARNENLKGQELARSIVQMGLSGLSAIPLLPVGEGIAKPAYSGAMMALESSDIFIRHMATPFSAFYADFHNRGAGNSVEYHRELASHNAASWDHTVLPTDALATRIGLDDTLAPEVRAQKVKTISTWNKLDEEEKRWFHDIVRPGSGGLTNSIQRSADSSVLTLGFAQFDLTNMREVNYQTFITSRQKLNDIFTKRVIFLTIADALFNAKLETLRVMFGTISSGNNIESFMNYVDAYNKQQFTALDELNDEMIERVDSFNAQYTVQQEIFIETTSMVSAMLPLLILPASGNILARSLANSMAASFTKTLVAATLRTAMGAQALAAQNRTLPEAQSQILDYSDEQEQEDEESLKAKKDQIKNDKNLTEKDRQTKLKAINKKIRNAKLRPDKPASGAGGNMLGGGGDFKDQTRSTLGGNIAANQAVLQKAQTKIKRRERLQKILTELVSEVANATMEASSEISGTQGKNSTNRTLGLIAQLASTESRNASFVFAALKAKVEAFNKAMNQIQSGATGIASTLISKGMEKINDKVKSKKQGESLKNAKAKTKDPSAKNAKSKSKMVKHAAKITFATGLVSKINKIFSRVIVDLFVAAGLGQNPDEIGFFSDVEAQQDRVDDDGAVAASDALNETPPSQGGIGLDTAQLENALLNAQTLNSTLDVLRKLVSEQAKYFVLFAQPIAQEIKNQIAGAVASSISKKIEQDEHDQIEEAVEDDDPTKLREFREAFEDLDKHGTNSATFKRMTANFRDSTTQKQFDGNTAHTGLSLDQVKNALMQSARASLDSKVSKMKRDLQSQSGNLSDEKRKRLQKIVDKAELRDQKKELASIIETSESRVDEIEGELSELGFANPYQVADQALSIDNEADMARLVSTAPTLRGMSQQAKEQATLLLMNRNREIENQVKAGKLLEDTDKSLRNGSGAVTTGFLTGMKLRDSATGEKLDNITEGQANEVLRRLKGEHSTFATNFSQKHSFISKVFSRIDTKKRLTLSRKFFRQKDSDIVALLTKSGPGLSNGLSQQQATELVSRLKGQTAISSMVDQKSNAFVRNFQSNEEDAFIDLLSKKGLFNKDTGRLTQKFFGKTRDEIKRELQPGFLTRALNFLSGGGIFTLINAISRKVSGEDVFKAGEKGLFGLVRFGLSKLSRVTGFGFLRRLNKISPIDLTDDFTDGFVDKFLDDVDERFSLGKDKDGKKEKLFKSTETFIQSRRQENISLNENLLSAQDRKVSTLETLREMGSDIKAGGGNILFQDGTAFKTKDTDEENEKLIPVSLTFTPPAAGAPVNVTLFVKPEEAMDFIPRNGSRVHENPTVKAAITSIQRDLNISDNATVSVDAAQAGLIDSLQRDETRINVLSHELSKEGKTLSSLTRLEASVAKAQADQDMLLMGRLFSGKTAFSAGIATDESIRAEMQADARLRAEAENTFRISLHKEFEQAGIIDNRGFILRTPNSTLRKTDARESVLMALMKAGASKEAAEAQVDGVLGDLLNGANINFNAINSVNHIDLLPTDVAREEITKRVGVQLREAGVLNDKGESKIIAVEAKDLKAKTLKGKLDRQELVFKHLSDPANGVIDGKIVAVDPATSRLAIRNAVDAAVQEEATRRGIDVNDVATIAEKNAITTELTEILQKKREQQQPHVIAAQGVIARNIHNPQLAAELLGVVTGNQAVKVRKEIAEKEKHRSADNDPRIAELQEREKELDKQIAHAKALGNTDQVKHLEGQKQEASLAQKTIQATAKSAFDTFVDNEASFRTDRTPKLKDAEQEAQPLFIAQGLNAIASTALTAGLFIPVAILGGLGLAAAKGLGFAKDVSFHNVLNPVRIFKNIYNGINKTAVRGLRVGAIQLSDLLNRSTNGVVGSQISDDLRAARDANNGNIFFESKHARDIDKERDQIARLGRVEGRLDKQVTSDLQDDVASAFGTVKSKRQSNELGTKDVGKALEATSKVTEKVVDLIKSNRGDTRQAADALLTIASGLDEDQGSELIALVLQQLGKVEIGEEFGDLPGGKDGVIQSFTGKLSQVAEASPSRRRVVNKALIRLANDKDLFEDVNTFKKRGSKGFPGFRTTGSVKSAFDLKENDGQNALNQIIRSDALPSILANFTEEERADFITAINTNNASGRKTKIDIGAIGQKLQGAIANDLEIAADPNATEAQKQKAKKDAEDAKRAIQNFGFETLKLRKTDTLTSAAGIRLSPQNLGQLVGSSHGASVSLVQRINGSQVRKPAIDESVKTIEDFNEKFLKKKGGLTAEDLEHISNTSVRDLATLISNALVIDPSEGDGADAKREVIKLLNVLASDNPLIAALGEAVIDEIADIIAADVEAESVLSKLEVDERAGGEEAKGTTRLAQAIRRAKTRQGDQRVKPEVAQARERLTFERDLRELATLVRTNPSAAKDLLADPQQQQELAGAIAKGIAFGSESAVHTLSEIVKVASEETKEEFRQELSVALAREVQKTHITKKEVDELIRSAEIDNEKDIEQIIDQQAGSMAFAINPALRDQQRAIAHFQRLGEEGDTSALYDFDTLVKRVDPRIAATVISDHNKISPNYFQAKTAMMEHIYTQINTQTTPENLESIREFIDGVDVPTLASVQGSPQFAALTPVQQQEVLTNLHRLDQQVTEAKQLLQTLSNQHVAKHSKSLVTNQKDMQKKLFGETLSLVDGNLDRTHLESELASPIDEFKQTMQTIQGDYTPGTAEHAALQRVIVQMTPPVGTSPAQHVRTNAAAIEAALGQTSQLVPAHIQNIGQRIITQSKLTDPALPATAFEANSGDITIDFLSSDAAKEEQIATLTEFSKTPQSRSRLRRYLHESRQAGGRPGLERLSAIDTILTNGTDELLEDMTVLGEVMNQLEQDLQSTDPLVANQAKQLIKKHKETLEKHMKHEATEMLGNSPQFPQVVNQYLTMLNLLVQAGELQPNDEAPDELKALFKQEDPAGAANYTNMTLDQIDATVNAGPAGRHMAAHTLGLIQANTAKFATAAEVNPILDRIVQGGAMTAADWNTVAAFAQAQPDVLMREHPATYTTLLEQHSRGALDPGTLAALRANPKATQDLAIAANMGNNNIGGELIRTITAPNTPANQQRIIELLNSDDFTTLAPADKARVLNLLDNHDSQRLQRAFVSANRIIEDDTVTQTVLDGVPPAAINGVQANALRGLMQAPINVNFGAGPQPITILNPDGTLNAEFANLTQAQARQVMQTFAASPAVQGQTPNLDIDSLIALTSRANINKLEQTLSGMRSHELAQANINLGSLDTLQHSIDTLNKRQMNAFDAIQRRAQSLREATLKSTSTTRNTALSSKIKALQAELRLHRDEIQPYLNGNVQQQQKTFDEAVNPSAFDSEEQVIMKLNNLLTQVDQNLDASKAQEKATVKEIQKELATTTLFLLTTHTDTPLEGKDQVITDLQTTLGTLTPAQQRQAILPLETAVKNPEGFKRFLEVTKDAPEIRDIAIKEHFDPANAADLQLLLEYKEAYPELNILSPYSPGNAAPAPPGTIDAQILILNALANSTQAIHMLKESKEPAKLLSERDGGGNFAVVAIQQQTTDGIAFQNNPQDLELLNILYQGFDDQQKTDLVQELNTTPLGNGLIGDQLVTHHARGLNIRVGRPVLANIQGNPGWIAGNEGQIAQELNTLAAHKSKGGSQHYNQLLSTILAQATPAQQTAILTEHLSSPEGVTSFTAYLNHDQAEIDHLRRTNPGAAPPQTHAEQLSTQILNTPNFLPRTQLEKLISTNNALSRQVDKISNQQLLASNNVDLVAIKALKDPSIIKDINALSGPQAALRHGYITNLIHLSITDPKFKPLLAELQYLRDPATTNFYTYDILTNPATTPENATSLMNQLALNRNTNTITESLKQRVLAAPTVPQKAAVLQSLFDNPGFLQNDPHRQAHLDEIAQGLIYRIQQDIEQAPTPAQRQILETQLQDIQDAITTPGNLLHRPGGGARQISDDVKVALSKALLQANSPHGHLNHQTIANRNLDAKTVLIALQNKGNVTSGDLQPFLPELTANFNAIRPELLQIAQDSPEFIQQLFTLPEFQTLALTQFTPAQLDQLLPLASPSSKIQMMDTMAAHPSMQNQWAPLMTEWNHNGSISLAQINGFQAHLQGLARPPVPPIAPPANLAQLQALLNSIQLSSTGNGVVQHRVASLDNTIRGTLPGLVPTWAPIHAQWNLNGIIPAGMLDTLEAQILGFPPVTPAEEQAKKEALRHVYNIRKAGTDKTTKGSKSVVPDALNALRTGRDLHILQALSPQQKREVYNTYLSELKQVPSAGFWQNPQVQNLLTTQGIQGKSTLDVLMEEAGEADEQALEIKQLLLDQHLATGQVNDDATWNRLFFLAPHLSESELKIAGSRLIDKKGTTQATRNRIIQSGLSNDQKVALLRPLMTSRAEASKILIEVKQHDRQLAEDLIMETLKEEKAIPKNTYMYRWFAQLLYEDVVEKTGDEKGAFLKRLEENGVASSFITSTIKDLRGKQKTLGTTRIVAGYLPIFWIKSIGTTIIRGGRGLYHKVTKGDSQLTGAKAKYASTPEKVMYQQTFNKHFLQMSEDIIKGVAKDEGRDGIKTVLSGLESRLKTGRQATDVYEKIADIDKKPGPDIVAGLVANHNLTQAEAQTLLDEMITQGLARKTTDDQGIAQYQITDKFNSQTAASQLRTLQALQNTAPGRDADWVKAVGEELVGSINNHDEQKRVIEEMMATNPRLIFNIYDPSGDTSKKPQRVGQDQGLLRYATEDKYEHEALRHNILDVIMHSDKIQPLPIFSGPQALAKTRRYYLSQYLATYGVENHNKTKKAGATTTRKIKDAEGRKLAYDAVTSEQLDEDSRREMVTALLTRETYNSKKDYNDSLIVHRKRVAQNMLVQLFNDVQTNPTSGVVDTLKLMYTEDPELFRTTFDQIRPRDRAGVTASLRNIGIDPTNTATEDEVRGILNRHPGTDKASQQRRGQEILALSNRAVNPIPLTELLMATKTLQKTDSTDRISRYDTAAFEDLKAAMKTEAQKQGITEEQYLLRHSQTDYALRTARTLDDVETNMNLAKDGVVHLYKLLGGEPEPFFPGMPKHDSDKELKEKIHTFREQMPNLADTTQPVYNEDTAKLLATMFTNPDGSMRLRVQGGFATPAGNAWTNLRDAARAEAAGNPNQATPAELEARMEWSIRIHQLANGSGENFFNALRDSFEDTNHLPAQGGQTNLEYLQAVVNADPALKRKLQENIKKQTGYDHIFDAGVSAADLQAALAPAPPAPAPANAAQLQARLQALANFHNQPMGGVAPGIPNPNQGNLLQLLTELEANT